MENKKKKGFTLIELLAIIVILAIIAVITVPIILNIIENSRMGAATDSAYGYKDAINKWYVSKLSEDNQFQLADSYTISSDGKLGDIEIPLSGNKPSGGYLNYSNNTLIGGCLVFGDYAVTFDSKGNASETKKGTCSSSSEQGGNGGNEQGGNGGNEQGGTTPTPDPAAPVVAVYASKGATETKTISDENPFVVGDYVKLGNDGFYVIAVPQSTTPGIPTYNQVVLMSEYNISDTSASTETGYNAPSNNGMMFMSNRTYVADNTTSTWRQDSSSNYDKPRFTESSYWNYCIATSSEPSNCPEGSKIYRTLYTNEEHAFIYDSNSNLYAPMENYKTYLEGIIGTDKIEKIRPMSYEEAYAIKSNSWAQNQEYWLGSGANDYSIWHVTSRGYLVCSYYDNNAYGYCYYCDMGVRPVIEISTSAF